MRTWWLLVAVLSGCGEERPRPTTVACLTWKNEIGPALSAACGSCHSGATAAGAYEVTTYAAILRGGSDEQPNVVAGDASSTLLLALSDGATPQHAGQADLLETLTTWVVACEARYVPTLIHAAGLMNPVSPGFHGLEVAAQAWDLRTCASCHGDDFGGSSAAPTCRSCHEAGPTACDTCHEAVPSTGAHLPHTSIATCSDCHLMPSAWDDEGHIRRNGAADPPPAEVFLTGLSQVTLAPADRQGPATVDNGGTCSQVYCHGAVLSQQSGTTMQPNWYAATTITCASCHGAPPPSHAATDCGTCHPTSQHLNGAISIGDPTQAECSGCHGNNDSPAPPRDLSGNIYTTAIGVGAHQAHLRAPSALAAPVSCDICHSVPTELLAPGHIDTTAPAEVDATLGWNRETQTCATAWCHGNAQPPWTSRGAVVCGSCHGLPPNSPAHVAPMSIADCVTCHAESVDVFGNVQLPSHANGVAEGDQ